MLENVLYPVILGAVEGLTEFLPVSSTAHLMLAGWALGLEQTEFLKSFNVIIQLGAILAVVALYWRRLLLDRRVFLRVAAAFLPTAFLGLTFYGFVKGVLLESLGTVMVTLFLGGVGLVAFETYRARRNNGTVPAVTDIALLTYRQCLIIGACQSLAMVPGVSRSAATIVGGLALGLDRKAIVEFSFLLAVPTMAAATGLDLLKSAGGWNAGQFGFLAIGFLTSFLTALLAVRWLVGYVSRRDFRPFGWYRIALVGLIVLALFAFGQF